MNVADMEVRPQEAAELLTAMAHPKRLMILCNLWGKERNVGELCNLVGMAQSPLSQHLSKLRLLRLVATRRDGQHVVYRLASKDVEQLLATLNDIYCDPN